MSFNAAIKELYFGCALLLAENYQKQKPEPKLIDLKSLSRKSRVSREKIKDFHLNKPKDS